MIVLFIGVGSIAKKHIAVLLKQYKVIEIIALRSSSQASTIDNIKNIYNINELTVQPDFIVISNPTANHIDAIKLAITLRKPLFIEKPLSHHLQNIDELITEINKADIKTYIACNLRFLDCLAFLKAHLDANKYLINEVNAYCGSYLPDWRPATDYTKSYSANIQMGGGVNLDLIHELDYIYWLFGKPTQFSKHLSQKSTLKINAPDNANYFLEYETFNASIILNYYRKDAKRTLEIIFDNDTWLIDILQNNIISTLTGNVIFASQQKIIDTYYLQMNYFINSINGNVQPMNAINEAKEVLEICLN